MKSVLEKAIREEAQRILGTEIDDFIVEHPAHFAHGDYATNIAMMHARKTGLNPRKVAEEFRSALEGKILNVASITVAGQGFLNFHLTRDFFTEKIAEAYNKKQNWGRNDLLRNKEIIFEYTSPNLFKPLHVGNLVGNIIGESISRIFEFSGAQVHRVNYPSDIGLTIAKGVWGLGKIKGDPHNIDHIGEAYRMGNESYEQDLKAKEEIEAVNRALYNGSHDAFNELRLIGIETSRKHFSRLCHKLGTTFDFEVLESEAGGIGTAIVREHTGHVFEESGGAVIFRGEKHGLHTRVFVNSQGLPTYEAKDIGNFVLKNKHYPNWTQYVVVTGSEQKEYFKVISAVLKEIFPETKEKEIEHISTGFLTLTTGKMSSRKGNVLTGENLITEVEEAVRERVAQSREKDIDVLTEKIAVGAIKYQILRQAIGTDIVFDKERALSLEGDSGQYLQYTHARIVSIEERAMKSGMSANTTYAPKKVYQLEKYLYQFPEIIEKAQIERAPHFLVTYLTELASEFNTFYAHEKIVDHGDEYAPYKIALASATRNTIYCGLFLLGIGAPEKM